MRNFKVIRDNLGMINSIETSLSGYELLSTPKLNKGCAFTREERKLFALEELLPHQIESLEQQVARMYVQYNEHKTRLGKNIYLNVLHDYNETLFYALVQQYLEEMLPIIYTPTVGEAVKRFSLEHRKTQGLYLSFPDQSRIKTFIDQIPFKVDLTVVTDGEGVLGLGDQGIGGIKISSAKLMVYTLCAGISPYQVLPIQLDVGTNNPHLLSDPMYLGWRHERITGRDYEDFISNFVEAITKKFPHILLHWEDFGRDNARRILTQYRDKICTFNGDIQSTGVVALACVLAGIAASNTCLKDQRIVIFGAGNAGIGIAEQLHGAFLREGLSAEEAYKHFWLIDKDGLILDNTPGLLSFQKPFAKNQKNISKWTYHPSHFIGLLDVVKNVKPTILIGCSTVKGAFTEEIIKTMAAHVEKPIIMPLSNPTEKSEANPEDILHWTGGCALIATGGPYPDVLYQNQAIRISQSNNIFAFPGIGLGAIASKARYLSDGMLTAATHALKNCSPILKDKTNPLLPRLAEIQSVSRQVALAVALQARNEGLSQVNDTIELNHSLNEITWNPRYYPYRKI